MSWLAANARTTRASRRRRSCGRPRSSPSARLAPGAAEAITGEIDVERVLWWRDQVTEGRDDSWHVGWLEKQNAELVRGEARVVEPGVVAVGERTLEYDELVVATGSAPALPALAGLEDVEYWTNRDAVWASAMPRSLVVLGGGPVGAELAQFFRRMGSEVTLVEHNARLLARLDPDAGNLLAARFEEDGIKVLLGTKAEHVERASGGIRLTLDSGEAIDAERLLVATGRRPNVHHLGLERLDVEVTTRGVTVDDRLRAGDGVWAIGDAAGVGLLTHLGKYQARVAAANLAGRDVAADYRAIPAAVFTDPQVASVGDLEGDGVVAGRYDIVGGRLFHVRAPEAAWFREARRRPRAPCARRRDRRRAGGGRVARPAHARRPCGGPARRTPGHDSAVPDVLRGDLRCVAGARRPPRRVSDARG